MPENNNFGNLNINLFNYDSFERNIPDTDLHALARSFLCILFKGNEQDWTEFLSWRIIKGIFIQRDPEIFRIVRAQMQNFFHEIFNNLKDSSLNADELLQVELFINNCMMYQSYLDWSPYESLQIPQYIDGNWTMVDYKITPIELTPKYGLEKIFITEDDRLWAMGFEPIANTVASPFLVFPGTNYPAGQGFYSTIDTDLQSFSTPGEKLFNYGRQRIRDWLDKQRHKAKVTGTSLGGALSLLCASEFGNDIQSVVALNPPGIYDPVFTKNKVFQNWDALEEKPEVYVQRQGADQISIFGKLHPDWHLYHVKAERESFAIKDHVVNYAGLRDAQFIPLDIEENNKKYPFHKFMWYTVVRSAFYTFIFQPYRYFLLPLIRFLNNRVFQFLMLIPLLTVCMLLVFPVSPPVIAGCFTGIAYLLSDEQNIKTVSKIPRSLLIGGAITLIVASAVLTFFMPLVTAIVLAVLIPLVKLSYNIIAHTSNKLLYPDESDGAIHAPELPRNSELDMYKNNIAKDFTLDEIIQYYGIRQIMIKGYEDISSYENSQGYFLVDGQVKTKAEILNPHFKINNPDAIVTRIASKAKIYEMEEALRIHNRLGDDDSKIHLQENYSRYIKGREYTFFSESRVVPRERTTTTDEFKEDMDTPLQAIC